MAQILAQISFRGPRGMVVRWQAYDQDDYDSEPLACPGSHDFLEGRLYFLQFSGVGTVKLEALFDVTAASDKAVPLELTIADVKKIATGTSMRRVFFRTDEGDIDVATAWFSPPPPPPPEVTVAPPDGSGRWARDDWNTIVSETERHHAVIAVLDIR
jgi:hypothetical protein